MCLIIEQLFDTFKKIKRSFRDVQVGAARGGAEMIVAVSHRWMKAFIVR